MFRRPKKNCSVVKKGKEIAPKDQRLLASHNKEVLFCQKRHRKYDIRAAVVFFYWPNKKREGNEVRPSEDN